MARYIPPNTFTPVEERVITLSLEVVIGKGSGNG